MYTRVHYWLIIKNLQKLAHTYKYMYIHVLYVHATFNLVHGSDDTCSLESYSSYIKK